MEIDKELDHIIKTKKLLDYAGFHDYLAKVRAIYDHKEYVIKQYMDRGVKPEDLTTLNFNIAERNVLGSLLLVAEEMAESVTPPDANSLDIGDSVKEPKEVFMDTKNERE